MSTTGIITVPVEKNERLGRETFDKIMAENSSDLV